MEVPGTGALVRRHVERGVVVEPTKVRICPVLQQHADDRIDVRTCWRAGQIPCLPQRGDQRREPIVGGRIGISAKPQQRTDEWERTVEDRVDEAPADGRSEIAIRDQGGIADRLA
jgi:hypothetical protein